MTYLFLQDLESWTTASYNFQRVSEVLSNVTQGVQDLSSDEQDIVLSKIKEISTLFTTVDRATTKRVTEVCDTKDSIYIDNNLISR